jgi:ketosteroid isomerase-like protein
MIMEILLKMAKRDAYFTDLDLQVLLESYDEDKVVIVRKGNTKACAIQINKAWQRIADRVNS